MKTITRRLAKFERKVIVVVAPENLPFDYDLLTPKEQDLSSVTYLLHDKAVELGYGKLEACRYHFVRNICARALFLRMRKDYGMKELSRFFRSADG